MYFGITTFEIRARIQRRTAVSGTGNINDIRIVFFDQPIQMNVDEVLSRGSSPVPEQSRFDLFGLERFSQQGILEEVDLTDAQVIRGAPVAVHLVEHVRRQRSLKLRRFGGVLAVGGDSGRQSRIEDKV